MNYKGLMQNSVKDILLNKNDTHEIALKRRKAYFLCHRYMPVSCEKLQERSFLNIRVSKRMTSQIVGQIDILVYLIVK